MTNQKNRTFMDSLSNYGADLDAHSMFIMFKVRHNLDISFSCALVYENLYRIGTKFGIAMEPEFPNRTYHNDPSVFRVRTLIEWHEVNDFKHLVAHEGFDLDIGDWPDLVVMVRTKETNEG